jgi:asparagine synthase (glutamine-hydrolysing)
VGFGHRRLSIIDVSTGQQPLFNEDGSVVMVFNGEIYNYQELIPELQALGHVFHTKSDTEVIVHAWEPGARTACKRFRGMFAFALWDRNRQTLFMARDRLGVKPLYYALLDDGTLLFGSELKSLLATAACARHRPAGGRGVLRARLRGRAAHDLQAGAQAAAGAHADWCAAASRWPEPREYWDVRFTLDNPISAGRRLSRLRERCANRSPAHDRRGAAGRLPVRRRRFECRGGHDGRAVRRPGEHLLDRFRRPGLQRSRLRPDGGRPLPHQPPSRPSRATTST